MKVRSNYGGGVSERGSIREGDVKKKTNISTKTEIFIFQEPCEYTKKGEFCSGADIGFS